MVERDDDFLSRWSRRKQGARDGLVKKPDAPQHKPGRMRTDPLPTKVADETQEAGGAESSELVEEAAVRQDQALEPADQVAASEVEEEAEVDEAKYENFDFDSLNYASDYKQFMKKGVPEAVRRRALRMLWSSNPILANIDGLNDYDEDFTDAAMVLKTFSSNYKVGSGYLSEEERMASYSEEARTVGSDATEEEAEVVDVEDLDVEDMDDGEDDPDEIFVASDEDAEDGKASDDEDTRNEEETA